MCFILAIIKVNFGVFFLDCQVYLVKYSKLVILSCQPGKIGYVLQLLQVCYFTFYQKNLLLFA